MLQFIKNTVIILITATAVYFSIMFPQAIGIAVKESADRCFSVILPSMFVFLCITTFISRSNIHSIITTPFRFISEKFFHISKEGFAVFLLSMISGYPAGIKLINDNFTQGNITSKQARIMNCCCFFSGPAFISGIATNYLYPESNAGLLIFLSCFFGNTLTLIIFTRKLPEIYNTNSINNSFKKNQLIPSVKSASSAMVQMCVMITAFGGFTEILKISGIIDFISKYTSSILNSSTDTTQSIIMSLLEISNIMTLPTMKAEFLPIVAFLISFGGICVHMQILSLAENNFSFTSFFIARILSSAISGITAYFLIPFLNIQAECYTSIKVVSENMYSPLPTFLLLIMMVMLMGTFKENKKTD